MAESMSGMGTVRLLKAVGRLSLDAPVKRGKCVVCGIRCDGYPVNRVVSGSFTAWSDLLPGEVVCPSCAKILKDPRFRRSSWVLTHSGVRFLDRRGALDLISNPPEEPFILYVSFAGRKHDYLKALRFPNGSRDFFLIAAEGYGLIKVERHRAERYHEIIAEALKAGLRKIDLLHGCRLRGWGRAPNICRLVESYRGDPLWEVMVKLS